jgi:hypothetical protein
MSIFLLFYNIHLYSNRIRFLYILLLLRKIEKWLNWKILLWAHVRKFFTFRNGFYGEYVEELTIWGGFNAPTISTGVFERNFLIKCFPTFHIFAHQIELNKTNEKGSIEYDKRFSWKNCCFGMWFSRRVENFLILR